MEVEGDDAFSKYLISNKWKLLDNIKERTSCPKCNKSRKYFCYTCYIPVSAVKNIIPQVSLPIKIDIIKHKREIDGKSTSAHAALLSPKNITILQYPDDILNYSYDSRTILIYPGKSSCSLTEYFENNPVLISSDKEKTNYNYDEQGIVHVNGKILKLPFDKAIFVDGTWNQSKAMYGCLKELPCIVLQNRISQFWRHQKNSPRWYLATIEAVHQLLDEIYEYCYSITNTPFSGPRDHDNLLFFFRYMYHIIHSIYEHGSLLSYRRR